MSRIIIDGKNKLFGELPVQGAKNAVLPILAATVLNGGDNYIHHCPRLKDVMATTRILKHLGCRVEWEGDTLFVNSANMHGDDIPPELMREMRSSIIFLGAVAARCGSAHISAPGGCEIGLRPIDLHLKALREMGMEIREEDGYIRAFAKKLSGTSIHLSFPSVGATENIMLAASATEDETIITNCAREPEIVDLAEYLKKMGVRIEGAGSDEMVISGTKNYQSVAHTVMADRIVATTHLCAAMMTHSPLFVRHANAAHLHAVLALLRESGGVIDVEDEGVYIRPPEVIHSVSRIRTGPYPGFPTDAQSLFLAMLTLADGSSMITETIFENRFKNTEELLKMGADISVEDRVAVVRGVERLKGARVTAPDLRGGASLLLAGLAAEGETVIENIGHIERGYESITEIYRAAGANIKRAE